MRIILTNILLVVFAAFQFKAQNDSIPNSKNEGDKNLDNINEITVLDMNKNEISLSEYNGKVLLIVNVASECGNTPQYAGLEDIYKEYKSQGFEILAFPCNDFGGQEPGTNEEIKTFCTTNYGVTFQLFDRVKILGTNAQRLLCIS